MYVLYIRVAVRVAFPCSSSKYCAHIRSVLINGMCNFKDGIGAATAATAPSVGLTSHTSPFCNDYNKLQSFAFLVFVFLFPTRQKLRFHLSYSHTSSLVFDVREPLCVKYENAWHCVAQAATQAKWHNKRNGASYVSTECCPPRYAVTVGSLSGGNGDMGATRKAIRPVDGL